MVKKSRKKGKLNPAGILMALFALMIALLLVILEVKSVLHI
ncbi:MAG: hypothetical protein ACM3IJ_04260 [Candidatus Levyibacteriota bacterium]